MPALLRTKFTAPGTAGLVSEQLNFSSNAEAFSASMNISLGTYNSSIALDNNNINMLSTIKPSTDSTLRTSTAIDQLTSISPQVTQYAYNGVPIYTSATMQPSVALNKVYTPGIPQVNFKTVIDLTTTKLKLVPVKNFKIIIDLKPISKIIPVTKFKTVIDLTNTKSIVQVPVHAVTTLITNVNTYNYSGLVSHIPTSLSTDIGSSTSTIINSGTSAYTTANIKPAINTVIEGVLTPVSTESGANVSVSFETSSGTEIISNTDVQTSTNVQIDGLTVPVDSISESKPITSSGIVVSVPYTTSVSTRPSVESIVIVNTPEMFNVVTSTGVQVASGVEIAFSEQQNVKLGSGKLKGKTKDKQLYPHPLPKDIPENGIVIPFFESLGLATTNQVNSDYGVKVSTYSDISVHLGVVSNTTGSKHSSSISGTKIIPQLDKLRKNRMMLLDI